MELDIVKYNNLGKVFVSGDMNSRTSDSPDYFDYDKYIDESFYTLNTSSIPVRTNKDRIIDHYGLRLLELCQATGLLIANGRLFSDKDRGKFTFCAHNGQSTVDYLLLNHSDFCILSNFDILDFNEHSDHAPILFSFKTKSQKTVTNETDSYNISRKIVWDKSKVTEFKNRLSKDSELIHQMTNDVANEPIDDVVQQATRILHDNAFEVFGRTVKSGNYTAHNKKAHKDWFNEDCISAQRDFKSARNNFKKSQTEESRKTFTRARTRFNRIKKKAKQKYKINEGLRVNRLAKSNPKMFWKNIKASYNKTQEKADTLTIEQLHDHFKAMFGETHDINPESDTTNFDLGNETTFEELDYAFTEPELRRAVFSQKDNKSPGLDSISSEIIKTSSDFISSFLLRLYNRMFNTGEYPSSWGEGIITPIFKKGDVNNSSNYRGITLINILAKIYSQLLLNRLTNWAEIYEKKYVKTNSDFKKASRSLIVYSSFIPLYPRF